MELELGICGKKRKSNHLSYLVAKMYDVWSVIKPGNVLEQKSVTDTTLHRYTLGNCATLKNMVFTSLIKVSKKCYQRLWCFKQKEQVNHTDMAHVTNLQTHLMGLLRDSEKVQSKWWLRCCFDNQKCSLYNTRSFEIMGSQGFNWHITKRNLKLWCLCTC